MARRLGGSIVQRVQAEARFGGRHVHTMNPDEVVLEVRKTKEALYDAIAKTEVSRKTWANMRLHQHLSAEITPRPDDPVWENYYSARRTFRLLKKAGLISLTFTVLPYWEYCRGYLDDKVASSGHDGGRRA